MSSWTQEHLPSNLSQQQQGGFDLPEGPVRWSWKVCLAVTLNSASVITREVSDYLTDVTYLLIKDYDARKQDEIRMEIESLDKDH